MRKLPSLKNRLHNIEKELETLKIFRITPQLKKFQRQLIGEKSFVKSEISKLESSIEDKQRDRLEKIESANRNRSSKNKRVWNYVKSIQKNYRSDLTLKNIRSQLKRHRQGLETDVSDVAWRNPSP